MLCVGQPSFNTQLSYSQLIIVVTTKFQHTALMHSINYSRDNQISTRSSHTVNELLSRRNVLGTTPFQHKFSQTVVTLCVGQPHSNTQLAPKSHTVNELHSRRNASVDQVPTITETMKRLLVRKWQRDLKLKLSYDLDLVGNRKIKK